MYKDDWEVLIGNCDSLLFLGGSDATTLEYISKKLGKETILAKNTSRSFGRQGSSSASMNTTGRELMQPDEIGRMDNLNCIVFLRGELPFFSKKYRYERHPNFKRTEDADKSLKYDVKKEFSTKPVPETTAEKSQRKRNQLERDAARTNSRMAKLQEGSRKQRVAEREAMKEKEEAKRKEMEEIERRLQEKQKEVANRAGAVDMKDMSLEDLPQDVMEGMVERITVDDGYVPEEEMKVPEEFEMPDDNDGEMSYL